MIVYLQIFKITHTFQYKFNICCPKRRSEMFNKMSYHIRRSGNRPLIKKDVNQNTQNLVLMSIIDTFNTRFY